MGIAVLLLGVLLVGFSWNAVVSITAAYASDRFGLTQLGTIYGFMFAVMPLGSGFGAYLGGLLYDAQGTYAIAIWSNIALLLLATGTVYTIKEKQLPGADLVVAR
jgi:MFS family permease